VTEAFVYFCLVLASIVSEETRAINLAQSQDMKISPRNPGPSDGLCADNLEHG
jgi:hypothetical protein